MGKIDLHMHSEFSSDGEFSVDELMKKCKAAGLHYMAIADHNSVKGSRIALTKQAEYGITCIPAVEIDATMDGVNYHILGYGIDVSDPVYDELEENVETQEREAATQRVALIRKLGIDFDDVVLADIVKGGIVTGEAIAEAAMHCDSEHKHPLLQPYYEGGNRSDNPYVNFYWDYCSPGKPAYVKIDFPSVMDIIALFHEQDGIAVVAHPGVNMINPKQETASLVAVGIDGMEVFSSYHDDTSRSLFYELVQQYELLMSCGSDFHGKTKPSVKIGMCDMPAEQEAALAQALALLSK